MQDVRIMTDGITVVPANEARCEDLQAVFGTRSIFAAAGFAEVSRPSARRVVMRIDF
jgi:hypothetical protein